MKINNNKRNPLKLKSGMLPAIHDTRTFRASGYLMKKKIPSLPEEFNWGWKIKDDKWGWLGNKRANNCTCVAAGHFIMTWTSNTGKLSRPKASEIVDSYCALTNYDRITDENDTGVECLKVLKHWRKTGIAGHQITAFAKLKNKNHSQLKKVIYLFGGCYTGLKLPRTAQQHYSKMQKWTLTRGRKKDDAAPGSWMGHVVLIIGYKNKELRFVSWGQEMIMSLDFWIKYSVESYAVFSEEFITNEKTPTGIDINILKADIDRLQKKKLGS